MATLSDYLRDGAEVWANCDTYCAHGAQLDIQALIDHPEVGDVTLPALKQLGLLRCSVCGQRTVHLNIQPPQRSTY